MISENKNENFEVIVKDVDGLKQNSNKLCLGWRNTPVTNCLNVFNG